MRARRRRQATGVAALGLCVALTGCVPQGLAFRVDDRLTFSAPGDRETVSLPVTLDWEIRDFEVVQPGAGDARDDAGYFAVFLDRAPVPPGRGLRWLARDDTTCRASEGCPDKEYLTSRGVYTTTATELVLDQLPRLGGDEDRRERHRAVVVLLDASGARIGESAFEIEFDIERNGTS